MPSARLLFLASFSLSCCALGSGLSRSRPQFARRQVAPPQAASAPKNSTATPNLPITPETWQTLRLDDYLQKYPNGVNLSLQDYAFSHHAQNFICGIGEGCNAGQLGNPVTQPDWFILYAAQEWNAMQNSIYTAIGFAVSLVQATAAAMVTDFYPPQHKSVLYSLQDLFILLSGVAFAAAVATLLFAGPAAVVVGTAIAGAMAIGTSTVLAGINLVQNWDTRPDGFTRWSNYAYYLAQWQSKVQDQLAKSVASVAQAGISSPAGISTVLKGGTFLTDVQIKPTSAVEEDIKSAMAARILVDIIKNQGGYVTYGSDPCDGKGPNGAWGGDKVISSCHNGTMMNIVRANGSKTVNKWHNAALITTKYGFSAEYLTTQSWECQQKYKTFGYDPYRNGMLPASPFAECLFNLPVCDCTDPKIKKARKKGMTTTKACRKIGKLPI